MKRLLICLANVVLIFSIALTSCNDNDKTMFVVTFDSKGGSVVASQSVILGGRVTEPSPEPTRNGDIFDGWYQDNTFGIYGRQWDFVNNTVHENITLYAKWLTWIQKADFAGGDRSNAVGFSIGNKGYVATGVDASRGLRNDFWEFDPISGNWTKKADFPGWK